MCVWVEDRQASERDVMSGGSVEESFEDQLHQIPVRACEGVWGGGTLWVGLRGGAYDMAVVRAW